MLKIGIGIATQGTIKSKTAFSLMETIRLNKELEIIPLMTYGGYIAENKSKLVKAAQHSLCSHILFVDYDMVFESTALSRLLSLDKDIVGVNYNYRYLPLKKMTVELEEHSDTEPFIVKAAGGGFLLVKMSVFDKLRRPYFPMEQDEEGNRVVTEDFGFYEEAIKQGYKIWCDPTIKVSHIGDYLF